MLRTVPEHYLELENIYHATLARGIRSLAVTAAETGEGVTSVITALANRNLHAGRATLIVDFNLFRPGVHSHFNTLLEDQTQTALPTPQPITLAHHDSPLAVVSPRLDRNSLIRLREPGAVEQQIELWKQDYDTILVDTSAINQINGSNLPAERVAASCDGALFVVLAGQTVETKIESAVKKLNLAGANIIGSIINDRDNPPLRQEMIREACRLQRYLPRLSKWLCNKINGNPFLQQEV